MNVVAPCLKERNVRELDAVQRLHDQEIRMLQRQKEADATLHRAAQKLESSAEKLDRAQDQTSDSRMAVHAAVAQELSRQEASLLHRERLLAADKADVAVLTTALIAARREHAEQASRDREAIRTLELMQTEVLAEGALVREQLLAEREQLRRTKDELAAQQQGWLRQYRSELLALQERSSMTDTACLRNESVLRNFAQEVEHERLQVAEMKRQVELQLDELRSREAQVLAAEAAVAVQQQQLAEQQRIHSAEVVELRKFARLLKEQSDQVALLYRQSQHAESKNAALGLNAERARRVTAHNMYQQRHQLAQLLHEKREVTELHQAALAEQRRLLDLRSSIQREVDSLHDQRVKHSLHSSDLSIQRVALAPAPVIVDPEGTVHTSESVAHHRDYVAPGDDTAMASLPHTNLDHHVADDLLDVLTRNVANLDHALANTAAIPLSQEGPASHNSRDTSHLRIPYVEKIAPAHLLVAFADVEDINT